MSSEKSERALYARYLRLLGIGRARPDRALLEALTAAQLQRVPFENLSKLLRLRRAGLRRRPGLEEHLDGIEQHGFGGTCYANNSHFHGLLRHLGFDARLSGADMTDADVHIVVLVRVEGREYLVDGGYGAPFLEPLPRDLEREHVVALGRDRYVLEPQDAAGRARLRLLREGVERHGYTVKPEPRRIEEFDGVVLDSYRPEAVFLNALLITRFFPGRSSVLHNLRLLHSQGERWSERALADAQELGRVVEEEFGIARALVHEALDGIDLEGDPWG